MLEIKIFGSMPPCAKCKKVEEVVKKVVEEYNGDIFVKKYEPTSDRADEYGIMMTPAVVVGDILVSSGAIPKEKGIKKAIDIKLKN